MYREHTIGVVVPAYNEEGFVGEVIDTMPEYVDRVYVVDDCSTDGTWDEIQRHAERANEESVTAHYDEDASKSESEPVATNGGAAPDALRAFDRQVVPIQREENRGVGSAIKTDYQRALVDEIDITAVMGGDGQMDPDILYKSLDPIVEAWEKSMIVFNPMKNYNENNNSQKPSIMVLGYHHTYSIQILAELWSDLDATTVGVANSSKSPVIQSRYCDVLVIVDSREYGGTQKELKKEIHKRKPDLVIPVGYQSALLCSTLLISESRFDGVFACFLSGFAVEFSSELERSEILCEAVF